MTLRRYETLARYRLGSCEAMPHGATLVALLHPCIRPTTIHPSQRVRDAHHPGHLVLPLWSLCLRHETQ